jgi:CRISPR-associated endonuclease/helicase Cas3
VPVVISLCDCIARPTKTEEEPFWLVTHLKAVAEGCGNKDGTLEEKLAFLAGLAHDAAKAALDWQKYIRSNDVIRRPPHAPLGAALFAFWAEDLLARWEPERCRREPLQDLALDWVRMIYRHHGRLDDLDDRPPWVDAAVPEDYDPPHLLATCDRPGLDELIHNHFPEYQPRLADFDPWFARFDKTWDRRQGVIRPDLLSKAGEAERDRFGLRLANLGAKLIFADRRHAAEWEPDSFPADDANPAIARHAEYCRNEAEEARKKGADGSLLRARKERQAEAVQTYMRHPDQHVFTLLLPTGYGKTLSGLRVALEAVRTGRCKRIVYVAPYISILSQAAKVIEDATGLPVFLHHHLSILAMGDDPNKAREDRQREDHQAYDLLDTWQAPIVATTFNQLFRALFPARAQECLRIPALDEAFVFIDEPQIVNVEVWCAFLRAMALTADQRKCQVLFCTATLPPHEDGLGLQVPTTSLVGAVPPILSRYVIRSQEQPWGVKDVANAARQKLKDLKERGSVAVILNTVRDAVETYENVGGSESNSDWLFVAAMMLPGHKARIIQDIRARLDPPDEPPNPKKDAQPTGVVCTQVLEAGVDLSFRSLFRAVPIFSSVAQAAGRANRHGEGKPAEVVVFPFVRDDGKDSRRYVYMDKNATGHTDRILAKYPTLPENELPCVLAEYYRSCWQQNDHRTSLQWFGEAAKGKWSALAGKEPFGGDYPLVDVLVPGAECYLPDQYRAKLEEFKTDTAEGLLAQSLDPSLRYKLGFPDRKLWFQARKRLSALLRQFTVAVPAKIAHRIADRVPACDWLWQLTDPDDYSECTGLAHHLTTADQASGVVVF